MRYPIVNPSAEQQQAWRQVEWDEACAASEQISAAFSPHDARIVRLRERVTFSDQSVAMLGALNDFDLRHVLEDILALTNDSLPRGVQKYWRNPQIRMTSTKPYQGRHHYLIDYAVDHEMIAIREIYLNTNELGAKEDLTRERVALYLVNRGTGARYDKPMQDADVKSLTNAWQIAGPVTEIMTDHAAVNGMNNTLEKAKWLMGVHLDAAYRDSSPKTYTLLHNPSRGGFRDLVECIWDKMPWDKSEPAQHLAAVLRQRHRTGKTTSWVVHSQGAIIFNAAVGLHNQRYGTPLSSHRVAVHCSGANLAKMRAALERASMKLVHARNNPFDLVPNVAGGNYLLMSSLYRSLRFCGFVFGDNDGNCALSPHTLPYLGVNNYKQQLEMAGEKRHVERVARYIARRNMKRLERAHK